MDEVPFVHGAVRQDGRQVTVCMICWRWKVGHDWLIDVWEKHHAASLHGDAIPILEAAT